MWGSISRRIIAGAVVASAMGLAAAQAADAPRDAPHALAYLQTLPPSQREQVERQEAKREGGLVLYGATGIDRAQFWIGEFHKRYPDIKVDFVRLQASELYEKIAAERRTGHLRADLVITTITYLDLLKDIGALAPYEPASWPDFDPRFRKGGRSQGWAATVYEIFPHAIAWRTDRVKDAEAPKTLAALADPKWHGRTGTTTHLEDTLNGITAKLGKTEGMALAKRLAALDNRLYRSHAALSDALGAGEVDIAWDLIAARAIGLKNKGAPVDYVLGNPQFAEGNAIAIGGDTENPYSAALFVDTMLAPAVLEASDRWSPGRIFGNRKGKFALSLAEYPNLYIFPALAPLRYKELNRLAETLFVR